MTVTNPDIRCHELLNEIYHQRKVGVEIGVYRGHLSWRMLAANRNVFLYLVDPWKAADEGDSYLTTDDSIARMTQAEHDENMRKTLESVAPFSGRYEVLRTTSDNAAKRFLPNELDFVFIDGDHSYEGCKADIAAWFPKLRNGGLLSGHDYRDERNYGVQQAVNEFVRDCGRELRLGGNYTWFVTK